VNPMVSTISRWAGFVKLSHTVFALPFALAAMLLAAREHRGWPGWRTFLLILVAMVCGRTCAMAFNRIADREFDARNPRTARRHLPAGQITLASAWTLCVISAAGLVAASWFLNPLCFRLSPLALFVICFYSLTKRFTDFTHVWLGVALAVAPVGAWLAVEGRFEFLPRIDGVVVLKHSAFVPLLLAAVVTLWLIGFDIIYATQDYDFDRTHGLHSLVVRWGPRNALGVSFLAHMVMWLLLAAFGLLCAFRLAYWIGLAIIFGCLMLEHLLARQRELQLVNVAFFRMNAIISIVFFVVTAVEVVFPWFRLRWYS
jgi:4-hydroxybenzoate polyprenyltransferase